MHTWTGRLVAKLAGGGLAVDSGRGSRHAPRAFSQRLAGQGPHRRGDGRRGGVLEVIYVDFEASSAMAPRAAGWASVLRRSSASATRRGRNETPRASLMTFVRDAPISMATGAQVLPQEPGALTMVAVMAAMSLVLAVSSCWCPPPRHPDHRQLAADHRPGHRRD